MKDIYTGSLVRLSRADPIEIGEIYSRWNRDSELSRLHMFTLHSLYSPANRIAALEKELNDPASNPYWFSIRTLDGDKFIGDIDLFGIDWASRSTYVGLAIGESNFQGKGFGTDVMRVILRYAFMELNLKRVGLFVFEFNPRAIRAYEKAGFRHEGRFRRFLNKEGKRWDMLMMGVLRDDWINENK